MSLLSQDNKLLIQYSQPEVIYGAILIMLLPAIAIGVIEIYTNGNDKPLLTVSLGGMFIFAGIYMLLGAYKRQTEIVEDRISVTTKPYFRNAPKVDSFRTQDIIRVDYFEGQWSGDASDPRSHIYLVFKDGKSVKIDSGRMYTIPFAKNNKSSLKSEAQLLANLLRVELNLGADETSEE